MHSLVFEKSVEREIVRQNGNLEDNFIFNLNVPHHRPPSNPMPRSPELATTRVFNFDIEGR
jgi:hypothetical protein